MAPITEVLLCALTDPDRAELRRKIRELTTELGELQLERRQFLKCYHHRVKALASEIAEIDVTLETGLARLNVECRVLYNQPRVGRKQIVRNDTNEIVRTEEMSDGEKQLVLQFAERENA